jgi:hypothetical protein
MKKTVILVIIGFLMSAVLFAEEPLAYKVTTTSEVYKQIDNKGKVEYDITITLNKGDIVYSKGKVKSDFIRSTLDYVFMMILAEPYDGYEIQVKNLSPINTENVFGKEIFIDYPPDRDFDDGFFLSPGDVKEMWVPGYYCSVLKSKDRETLLKFNSTVVVLSEIKGGQSDYWYGDDRAGIRNGRCMFYNAAIKIGEGTNFLVKNIKKTEYGYAVNCVESASDYRDKEGKYRTLHKVFQDTSEFWEKYKPSDEMTLYLYLDGDYMDIYVDGKDLHLGTIVKVKKEFIEEYQSLIRFNTCDLSRITSWPRRADGSMDYPSVSATDINNTEETENYDDSAIAEFAKEKPTNKGSGVKIIMIAGIAVLLGGGAAAFLIKHRK